MGNRFVQSACLMVWLAATAGGVAAESAPGVATPDAKAGSGAPSGLRAYVSVVNTWPIPWALMSGSRG